MKIEKDHFEHDNLVDFMNKGILVISGAGFPQFEDNFLGLKIQLRNLFHNYIGDFFSEAPMLIVAEAKPVTETLLNEFYNEGKEFS